MSEHSDQGRKASFVDTETAHQTQGHGHEGEKNFTIIVNGRQKTITNKELSFDQVVALAFDPVPSGPNMLITVAYRRGEGNKPEGTLTQGETVKVKDGMNFDVTATDQS
jgi:Multiubiquitin